ncbi:unnamed protein product [Rhizoctonia solani]|uniref:Uncharacterized protein n=1 Tax=Rhizoctonia solani TaxID=456999 RepID=A0A8H3CN76_9AGAM|nr:unnamed protein product [Rhizoctonia solani]
MFNAGHKLAGSGFRGSWNGNSQDLELFRLGSVDDQLGSREFRGRFSTSTAMAAPPDPTTAGVRPPIMFNNPINSLYNGLYNWFMPPVFNLQVGENTTHANDETMGEMSPSGNTITHIDVDMDHASNSNVVHQDSGSGIGVITEFEHGFDHGVDMGLGTMEEAVPDSEKEMDQIQANLISWSGCHQRQKASEHRDNSGGYFTSAFTRAVEEISKTSAGNNPRPSLGQVHALVECVISLDTTI